MDTPASRAMSLLLVLKYPFSPNSRTAASFHKAKGREFDAVFLLLNQTRLDAETSRALYVGMTRAKEMLCIHFNHLFFLFEKSEDISLETDNTLYPSPDEQVHFLGHRDVFLDYFKGVSPEISRLCSGDQLVVSQNALLAPFPEGEKRVLIFSSEYNKRHKALLSRGYSSVKAKVRAIVVWENQNDNCLYPIILPEIWYQKQQN